MKKITAVVCMLLLPVFLLCGCATLSSELSARGIVGAMGIDYEMGQYTVTILLLSAGSQARDGDGQAFHEEILTGTDNDLRQAFRAAENNTSKEVFYGHNTILIWGRELVESRLLEVSSYLSQNRESRLNISVCMVRGRAEEFLRLKIEDQSGLGGSVENLLAGGSNGFDVKVQLFSILQELPSLGVRGFLPVLRAFEPGGITITSNPRTPQGDAAEGGESGDTESERSYDITVDSIAILWDSKLVDIVSGDIMAGIMLSENRVNTLSLDIEASDSTHVHGQLLRAHTRIGCTPREGIAMRCAGTVTVVGHNELGGTTDIRELRSLFEAQIAGYMIAACRHLYTKLGIDFFDFEWYWGQATSYSFAERAFESGVELPISIICSLGITG